jgi:hypothetical protein
LIRTDLTIYYRAIVMLVRRPSIFVAPLLGAVVALVLDQLNGYLTNAIGGALGGIFTFFANVFYSFAFGIAIIQADQLERGLRGTFDGAWEDARHKAGGIIVAAIGFWFLVWIAQYIGALLGSLSFQVALMLVAAFFLIYTIPAASIGGLPGSLAIAGSIRSVRSDWIGSALLAIVFVALFVVVAPLVALRVQAAFALNNVSAFLVQAAIQAIFLGYLAFPFAKQYAGTAFRRS